MWLEYTWIPVYRWGWNDENQPRRHQSQLWWAYQQHCFWPRGCGRRGCLLNLLLQPVGGGQEMMVDACLKMGYPKFPWVINVYHPFPPKEESIDVNCIGGQELLNNSWKGSTWISRIRKSWDLRSKCGGVLAEQSGQSPLEYDGTLHLHVVGPDVATVRIFWDRISGSFQRESNDFMAVNLGIPNVQTNEDKASWSLVLECSW